MGAYLRSPEKGANRGGDLSENELRSGKEMKLKIVSLVFVLFLLFVINLPAQINFQANSYIESAIDTGEDDRYFEDWTDVSLNYKNWRAGIRYEFHRPPFPFNQDKSSWNDLTQRFIEYRTGNMMFTAGNFYTLLGRGLVLRSYENRILRWDNNIDGGKFEFFHNFLDLKLLAGRMRDQLTEKHKTLYGGSINLKPISLFHFGGTFVQTKITNQGDVRWGSLFAGLSLDWADFYFEHAIKDFPKEKTAGKAYYVMGNAFRGPVSVLVEFRKYDRFNLEEGALTFNNPPTVYREHLYTLLNRHQLVQDANDEEGYMVEVCYTLGELGILTLNHSRTKNSKNAILYREYYGQFEMDPSDALNLVLGGGHERDAATRYLNFVSTAKWGFGEYKALKIIFEHQHEKILLTDRQFYNQAITLSYEHASRFTLSLLTERTTEQEQFTEKNFWIGGQLDVHLPWNFDVTVFGGSRREGKICAGGVCIERPAFEGVEFRLIHRF